MFVLFISFLPIARTLSLSLSLSSSLVLSLSLSISLLYLHIYISQSLSLSICPLFTSRILFRLLSLSLLSVCLSLCVPVRLSPSLTRSLSHSPPPSSRRPRSFFRRSSGRQTAVHSELCSAESTDKKVLFCAVIVISSNSKFKSIIYTLI
jgi:hypothetical protein